MRNQVGGEFRPVESDVSERTRDDPRVGMSVAYSEETSTVAVAYSAGAVERLLREMR